MFPALRGWFFITGPPGKSLDSWFRKFLLCLLKISKKKDIGPWGPQSPRVDSVPLSSTNFSLVFNIHSLIHQIFNEQPLQYFPDIAVGPGDAAVSKTVFAFRICILVEGGDNKQMSKWIYSTSDGDKSYKENIKLGKGVGSAYEDIALLCR